jgi:hypothetical protein
LPNDLRSRGYVVTQIDKTMRIVPNEIVESIAAAKSSVPPTRIIRHAGLVPTKVFELFVRTQ